MTSRILARRNRLRGPSSHSLGALPAGVDAALHVADPFAVFGARNADFGTFPADMLVVLRAD
ncbi:hypothetical protein AJ87_44805 [Rhizobium yanglingense]|nr:hypothetical protein AJ87_44805 [Rhizobium yanglingense]